MAIVLDGSTGISGIGTLTGVTSISSTTADTPVILQDSSSNSNTCRAWVNFNGTSTVAIRADFNVSSVADNGTGDYTVNFTTAMPDANYCAVFGQVNVNGGGGASFVSTATVLTTSVRMYTVNNATNGLADAAIVTAAIFR
jgi:hypothetical protein